jgi:hypothetical protein
MLAGAGAQFFDNNGVPLNGGLLYTYAAGTTTPQTTYTTNAGNIAHTNPIVLNSAGRVASGGEIWLSDAVAYKFILATSASVTIATYDNITGNNSGVNAQIANIYSTINTEVADIYSAFAAPSGSSLVGYVQAGTGAVATTVQTRLRQTVSVKDFGAVGDGVTDDTAAIQAAINTGNDVYFPLSAKEIYVVSSQLVVSTTAQRLYGGLEIPRLVTANTFGKIKFTSGLASDFGILVTAAQVCIEGLGFDGINRNVEANSCIEFARITNTDDMDGRVRNCHFFEFVVAVKHVGRGLSFELNTVTLCNYGVDSYWPTSGVNPIAPEQDLPFGNRALRIVNNRFHVLQFYCIRTNLGFAPYNALLRGALISGNTVDLGEGLIEVNGDLYNTVISDNVVEFSSRVIIYGTGNFNGVVITNNVFAGQEGVPESSPFAAFQVAGTGTVTDLVFSNNRISDIDGDAILFNNALNGASIIGNSFRRIGVDGNSIRACLRGFSMTGVSFVGNSCYPVNAPYIFRTNSSADTLTNVTAQLNNYSATGGFNNGAFINGGGNSIQS